MHSSSVFRAVLFFGILILADYYAFSAVKTVFTSPRNRQIVSWIYWGMSAAFVLFACYVFLFAPKSDGPSSVSVRALMGAFVFLYIPKLFVIFFLGTEDLYRLLRAGVVGISNITGADIASGAPYFESRRKFISQIAMLAASIPAAGILYGIVKGRYNYKVHNLSLSFKDLPEAFHGMTITQISDLHIGSFNDTEEVARAVELINEQRSDVVFFTGDLVNNRAEEMEPWVDIIGKIDAPLGKYSILGNHDYGDYVQWPSRQAKQDNMQQLYGLHERIGFKLLRNESHTMEKDGHHLELLGMENWGHGFAQYGDLNKTLQGTREGSFKILLSHDPSHWENEVMSHENHIHLTLSGHTHGMQFGLEIPGIKISPVQLKYRRWAGLYTENDRHLYVNRGLGFIGFPGRVGIWPEITVITLQKA